MIRLDHDDMGDHMKFEGNVQTVKKAFKRLAKRTTTYMVFVEGIPHKEVDTYQLAKTIMTGLEADGRSVYIEANIV